MPAPLFPSDFLWGTATAAHQVEGQNFNNDWWDWEQVPGHIKNGDKSQVACGWWAGRFQEDLKRAQSLGNNAHRLSVEWSRIEPREGEFDSTAVERYRAILTAIRQCEMAPVVTLHHFASPHWLATRGGWEDPASVQRFVRFARHAVGVLQDLCSFWVTINEPNVLATYGYALGKSPPGKKSFSRAFRVISNLVRAHAGAYHAIKALQPDAQVGVAHHFRLFYPHRSNSRLDRLVARLRDRLFNKLVLLALEDGRLRFPVGSGRLLPEVRGTQDFIGLNYYYTDPLAFDLRNPGELFARSILNPLSQRLKDRFDAVGNIEPKGIEQALLFLSGFHKPIYITENGVPDDGDQLQSSYLVTHLAAVRQAMAAGADVRGYFWWTLVDNFEWNDGYGPRFGLYHLDVDTQVRTPRPVADVYARIIREHGIPLSPSETA